MSTMNNTCRMSSTEKKEPGNNKRSPIHNGSTLNLGWSESKDTANMKLRQIQTRMYLIWKKQIKVISRLKCTQYSGIVSPVCAHVGRHALRYLYCNLSHCCIMPSYTIYILGKKRVYTYTNIAITFTIMLHISLPQPISMLQQAGLET